MNSGYFIQRGAKVHGPFSVGQLRGGLRSDKLSADDLVSGASAGPWAALRDLLPELVEEDPLGFDGLLDAQSTFTTTPMPKLYCRSCGHANPADTIACFGCGVPPRRGRNFCGSCGHGIASPEVVMCVKCRTMFDPVPIEATHARSPVGATSVRQSPIQWYLGVLRNYAVFRGRARRREYWMFVLVNFGVLMLLGVLEFSLRGPAIAMGEPAVFGNLYSLAVFIPSVAVAVRRMHDTNHSGWFLLVPFYNLYLACIEGTKGPNRFGSSPKPENEFGN